MHPDYLTKAVVLSIRVLLVQVKTCMPHMVDLLRSLLLSMLGLLRVTPALTDLTTTLRYFGVTPSMWVVLLLADLDVRLLCVTIDRKFEMIILI